MPELPDLAVYLERLQAKVQGQVLRRVRVLNPFVLRTAVPPIDGAEGQAVTGVERVGKRIVLALANGQFLVIHLMIAGRLRWLPPAAKAPGGKLSLAVLQFDEGQLVLTEAGTTRRAAIHLLADRAALQAADPGGLEPIGSTVDAFAERLKRENHTLKRALTMPQLFAGIGNAYSDEVLHRARLSPVKLTRALDDDEIARLHGAVQAVIGEWTERLRAEAGDWPDKVTAFHPQMAVHGRYGQPCPVCGAPVQRIVHADNECNYCARCQTGGRLLADRALSRLLKSSWPKSIDDL
ncbi:MAG: DNA-formamidopyrimidine glycosylase family protein [Rubrivivax sp.]